MATNIKKTKKVSSKISSPITESPSPVSFSAPSKASKFPLFLITVVLLGVALFLFAKKYKNQIVVAFVNKTPISRFTLNSYLFDKYGKTSLEDIINNTLIEQLAVSNKIDISKEDMDGEIKTLEDQLGGKEALKASMDRFGYDQAKLEHDIRLILIQKKISQKLFTVSVTDDQIKSYYDTNKDLFAKQTFDAVKSQIKSSLEQDSLQQQFTKWFQEQRTNAKIQIFI